MIMTMNGEQKNKNIWSKIEKNKKIKNNYKEKEYIIIMMVIDMKVIGKMIKKKEKEYIIIRMEQDMKEIGKMVNQKEKEYIIIMMVIDMKEIGKMVKEREKG